MTSVRRIALSFASIAAVVGLASPLLGCTGDARRGARPSRTQGDAGDGSSGRPSSQPGEVALTDADLAPMDAYIRRRVWVLADDVEIVASKEYFIQNLSISATTGYVKREDFEGPDEARSVLTFLRAPEEVDVATAPRVNVGIGLTVTARRTITIRFVRTTNPDLPVRLRVAANGRASLGSGTTVRRREENIVFGAHLRRGPSGAYVFEEQ